MKPSDYDAEPIFIRQIARGSVMAVGWSGERLSVQARRCKAIHANRIT
jgi:hypothetical protein